MSKNPAALQQNWETQGSGLFSILMHVSFPMQAGYMSGMLVPVGVGIAGALFILGVLYSIKVMNRRRRNVYSIKVMNRQTRNGFKRHKRKVWNPQQQNLVTFPTVLRFSNLLNKAHGA